MPIDCIWVRQEGGQPVEQEDSQSTGRIGPYLTDGQQLDNTPTAGHRKVVSQSSGQTANQTAGQQIKQAYSQ
jgi:hypothetical protein